MNEAQNEAITTTEGPVVIIAGAGSGKTETLARRAEYMTQQGIRDILMITFTNKAANEIRQRVERAEITVCTFHSFCALMLKTFGTSHFRILTSEDETDAIEMRNTSGIPSDVIQRSISACVNKNSVMEKELPKRYRSLAGVAEDISDWLSCYKDTHGYLGYDDLLVKCRDLLKTNETAASMYKYIMVDEYQDTNALQNEILSLMHTRNIAVVGDDMQSIYGFRGSDAKNILTFANRFPDCKVITMSENYRSTQEILDVANFINDSADGIKKTLHAARGSGVPPLLLVADNEEREAEHIAKMIEMAETNICVLARNVSSLYNVSGILEQKNIPFAIRGGKRFFDQPHIRDIISAIRVAYDKNDELAYFRCSKIWDNIHASETFIDTVRDIAESYPNPSDDINRFVDIAQNFDSAESFFENMDSISVNDDGKIILSTIHSAKGLEFDTVFVMDCVDLAFFREDDIRCLYVAATRAKNVILFYAPRIFKNRPATPLLLSSDIIRRRIK